MRSVFKKMFIIALVLVAAITLFSCSGEDSEIPEGMQIASLEGEPFKLFVPKNWTLNSATGVSGAYLSSDAGISVTVTAQDGVEGDLATLVEASVEEYKAVLENFELVSEADVVLDKRAAKKVVFSALYDGARYSFMRIFAKYEDDLVIFSYKAKADFFETYLPEAEGMLEVFKFCEPTKNGENKTDKDTPQGMKIASTEDAEYRLYVPSDWMLDKDEKTAFAYVSDTDKSNVSLTSYSPRESMSIDGYFDACETEYKKIYENYQRQEDAIETQMAGKLAKDYRFSFEHNGEKYESRQVICIYRGMFYILTYTAKAESFELHTEEVEKIISEVAFR